jgi:hypothetical protein
MKVVGIRSDIVTNPYVLLFDEHVLRESPGFTSLWQRDYPLEKLSQRRRNATFGWVNKTIRPIGAAESKAPSARFRVIIHFYFTSQMVVSQTGGQFPR